MTPDLMQQCVNKLAEVKSKQDIQGALGIYHPQATLVTVGLGVEAKGRAEIERQLNVFFALFPDYRVTLNQVACSTQKLLATGVVQVTPAIAEGNKELVAQSVALAFEFQDGCIIREEFFLDFSQVCKKAGISLEQLAQASQHYLTNNEKEISHA